MAALLCIYRGAMKRTTIMIPDELKMRAIKYASRMGMSLGGFIRESVERALEPTDGEPAADTTDPLFADDAVFSGETPSDLAESHDDYLYGDRK
jgi:predicted DNA-binding protein